MDYADLISRNFDSETLNSYCEIAVDSSVSNTTVGSGNQQNGMVSKPGEANTGSSKLEVFC